MVNCFSMNSWVITNDAGISRVGALRSSLMSLESLFTGRGLDSKELEVIANGWEESGVCFIFGRDDGDYPADNSVRRAMLARLQSGKRLRSRGMFFLEEHMGFFDSQYYRRGGIAGGPVADDERGD